MRKVVILALHLNFGGVEKFISDVANALSEENDVTIVSTYKIPQQPFFKLNDTIKTIYLTDVTPNRIEFFKALESKNPFKILYQGIKATRVLIKKKLSLKKYLKNLECDTVITTRLEQTRVVNKYCSKTIFKIATEHNHHNNNQKYIDKVYLHTKDMDKFVLISEELYKFYNNIFKDSNVDCINIKHFVCENKVDNNQRKEVLSVGRLSIEKGYSDLLKVAKIMPEVKFNIVGDGILKEELNAIIKRDKLSNVIMHGSLNSEDIQIITNKCFAYAMTSHTESFGLVLIEALSSGVPCVAFDDAKGACEIIESGVNGYLVSNRDIEEFARCIYLCSKDYENLSKNAFKVLEKYSYKNFCKQWNSIVK